MPLDAAQTKRDRLEKKEAAIVDAATDVYLEKGFEKTTMAEIARRADVADGTLYTYFKNKNALMMAVVAAHWARITDEANKSISSSDNFFDAVEAHARYHITMLLKDWRLIDLSYVLYYMQRMPEIEATAYKREYSSVFDRVYNRALDRGEIRSDVPLRHARDLFYGTLEYAARTQVQGRSKQEVESIVKNLVAVIREGFAPSKPSTTREAIVDRLEAAVARLESVSSRKPTSGR